MKQTNKKRFTRSRSNVKGGQHEGQWLVSLSHIKKVVCSIPDIRPFCVEMHVLPISMWITVRFSCFLTQSKNMHVNCEF